MCLYEVRLTRVQYVQQVFPELSMREITNGEDYDYQLVLHICSVIVHFFTVNVVVWWSSIHLLWLVFVTYWLTWCLVCCLMLLFAVKLSKICLNFIFGVFNYCFYSAAALGVFLAWSLLIESSIHVNLDTVKPIFWNRIMLQMNTGKEVS